MKHDEDAVEELAAELYEAYSAAVGGVAFNGEPLPDWEEFCAEHRKQKQEDAWRAVARRAAELSE